MQMYVNKLYNIYDTLLAQWSHDAPYVLPDDNELSGTRGGTSAFAQHSWALWILHRM